MAVDYFLKIEGVDGESTDGKHKNEIDVMSYSFGATQAGSMSYAGGGGAGKVSMQDFHFTMKVCKATPKLFLSVSTGEHFKKAILTARKAGKEQQEYLKVTMSDVLVTSYQHGASSGGDPIPVESIALNFAKIEFEYKPQKPDGTLDGAIKAGYDLKLNQKV